METYLAFLVGFVVTLLGSALLVFTKSIHGRLSLDDTDGVQKMHDAPTPRIGGVAIALGFVAAGLFLDSEVQRIWIFIGLSGTLAFGFGLAEDITRKVRVKWRLLATIGSGLTFALVTGFTITSIQNPWFDLLLAYTVGSLAFTAFAIGGAANAINIVDGFHGLSAGTMVIILATISHVAWRVGDPTLLSLSLTMLAIVVGFLLINFPNGYLFLGDAGAYFCGFVMATLVVMLPARHPEVSPWVSLLILGYPVTETIASILRRWRRKISAGDPDNFHLHHFVHRTLAPCFVTWLRLDNMANATTGVLMWFWPATIFVLVALTDLTLWPSVSALAGFILIYTVAYQLLKRMDQG